MMTAVATIRCAGAYAHRDHAVKWLARGVATAVRRATAGSIADGPRAGAYLVNVDVNSYIDSVLGFSPLLSGHAPEAVVAAFSDQLHPGLTFGAQHQLEAEVAERIVEAVPCGWWFLLSQQLKPDIEATIEAASGALAQMAAEER
jgi:glutamate-1-semialdehyde 2,1-aminomutase